MRKRNAVWTRAVWMLVLAFGVTLRGLGLAQAEPISPEALGPHTVVENFENVDSSHPSLSVYGPVGDLLYRWPQPTLEFARYTTPIGAELTEPYPNGDGVSNPVALIGDFSFGSPIWSLGGLQGNGVINGPEDLPSGNVFLGIAGASSEVELTFPVDVVRVGAYVTAYSDTVTLSAYDALGNLLESTSVFSVSVDDWRNNFIGLENAAGIRSITLSGAFVVVDDLSIDTGAPVACSDGADNDGDGEVDFGAGCAAPLGSDCGCTSPSDLSEVDGTGAYPCDDGLDNDGDGLIDFGGDPGCGRAAAFRENPQCNDGLDNDAKGGIDFDGGASASQQGTLCTGLGVPFDCCTGAGTGCMGSPDGNCQSGATPGEGGCGFGYELALLVPILASLRRRLRAGFA